MPEVISNEIEFWDNRYKKEQIGWHIEDVHEQLIKYLDILTGGQPCRIFVPLCGKTIDIPFLLSLGHSVFGVDCVRAPIEELNQNHKLGMKFDEENCLFYTEDRKLQIYCGDFFTCPVEKYGPFDAVWDRASYCAVDYDLRPDYSRAMQRSLRNVNPNSNANGDGDGHGSGNSSYHKFKYLLQVVTYDRSQFNSIPRSVDETDIARDFEGWASVVKLEEYEAAPDSTMRKVNVGIPADIREVTYLITPLF